MDYLEKNFKLIGILIGILIICSNIGLSLCVYYYIDENNKKKEEQDQNKMNGLIAGISLLSFFSFILLTLIIILFYNQFKIKQQSIYNSPLSYQKLPSYNTPLTGETDPLKTPETGESRKSDLSPKLETLKAMTKKTFGSPSPPSSPTLIPPPKNFRLKH